MPTTALARSLTLLVVSLASVPLVADDGTHRCASIANDQARLDCYDAAFGRPAASSAAGMTAPASGVAASATPAPTATAKSREEFGLSEVDKRARNPQQDVEPASITAQVAKLGRRPTGETIVSLADGQVWTQIESENRSRVKVGDTVTIRKGTLGSYLLVGPDGIAVRVRRVK
ncbi:MAG TPA: hypothetical protein VFI92_16320 [Steroidobacteraceae bacterium]|nr:hypothetical protein [Steroidobacteraceae bacterium]